MTDVEKHRRAYVRPSKRSSETAQLKAVLSYGAAYVYVEGKAKPLRTTEGASVLSHPDAKGMWLRSLREGDEAVVATAGRAGSTRKDIAHVIDALHAKGVVLVEAMTGRRSDNWRVAPQMMLDAVQELSNEHNRFNPRTAKIASAKAAAQRRPRDRMPVKDAKAIWDDVDKYPTTGEALDAMDGWSTRTAYLYLGPRHPPGSHGGRPRSNKR